MPRISLTDFVDIILKSGPPKATKVSQVKRRGAYDPRKDFYRSLRDGLLQIHRTGQQRIALGGLLTGLTDRKKVSNYPAAVAGYRRWWGLKQLVWFAPPATLYLQHGVEVSINPELGLVVNGQPHVVKLYLKEAQLSKVRITLITGLMEFCLRAQARNAASMSVMDVRRGRLFTFPGSQPTGPFKAMADAELSYVSALWPHV